MLSAYKTLSFGFFHLVLTTILWGAYLYILILKMWKLREQLPKTLPNHGLTQNTDTIHNNSEHLIQSWPSHKCFIKYIVLFNTFNNPSEIGSHSI